MAELRRWLSASGRAEAAWLKGPTLTVSLLASLSLTPTLPLPAHTHLRV